MIVYDYLVIPTVGALKRPPHVSLLSLSIIDLWNSNAVTRAARALYSAAFLYPCRTSIQRLLFSHTSFIAVLLFLVDDHAIVSCRSARTRHVHCPFFTQIICYFTSLSFQRMSDSLPCVDVLGSAPARRSHGSPSADFLTKKTNKSTLLKKIDVCRSRWMINTIMIAHAATYSCCTRLGNNSSL